MVLRSVSISECGFRHGQCYDAMIDRSGAVWMISTLPLTEERSRRVRLLFSGILGRRAVLECQRCWDQLVL